MIEGTLEHLLLELGETLDEFAPHGGTSVLLSLSSDGRTGRERGVAAISGAQRTEFRRLIRKGVDEAILAQKVTLTVDTSDEDVFALPPRCLKVFAVEDDEGDGEVDHIWKPIVSRHRVAEAGFLVEPTKIQTGMPGKQIRFWNADPEDTVYAHVLQIPARMSYGTAAAVATSTLTLASSPALGETHNVNDWYNGVRVAIVAGTGINQIRQFTDYVGTSRVGTLTAWSTNPDTTSSTYSTMLELPIDCWRSVVLLGAVHLLRIDQVLDEETRAESMKGVFAEYRQAHEDSLDSLNNQAANYAASPRRARAYIH